MKYNQANICKYSVDGAGVWEIINGSCGHADWIQRYTVKSSLGQIAVVEHFRLSKIMEN